MGRGTDSSRYWTFTNFDLDFRYSDLFIWSPCSEAWVGGKATYLAYGLETCPKTKKQHHQGFVVWKDARSSIKGVAKDLGGCHVEKMKGSLTQNEDYCSKEKWLTILGDRPMENGKKRSLAEAAEEIAGGTSVDALALASPTLYHQYGRTLSYLETIALRKKRRTWMTEGIWYFGPTDVGKSHEAWEHDANAYLYPWDGGWWDGYRGEETVIINEFRGGIQYSEILDLVDKWPKYVRRRGKEPIPFLAKRVVITSPHPPERVYCNLAAEDSLEQLYRRFQVICIPRRGERKVHKLVGGNTDPDPVDFSSRELDCQFAEQDRRATHRYCGETRRWVPNI